MKRLLIASLASALMGVSATTACAGNEAARKPAAEQTAEAAAQTAEKEDVLQVGQMAPDFSLPGSDGKTHSLEDLAGKKAVVIAWFPKAFTGG